MSTEEGVRGSTVRWCLPAKLSPGSVDGKSGAVVSQAAVSVLVSCESWSQGYEQLRWWPHMPEWTEELVKLGLIGEWGRAAGWVLG